MFIDFLSNCVQKKKKTLENPTVCVHKKDKTVASKSLYIYRFTHLTLFSEKNQCFDQISQRDIMHIFITHVTEIT